MAEALRVILDVIGKHVDAAKTSHPLRGFVKIARPLLVEYDPAPSGDGGAVAHGADQGRVFLPDTLEAALTYIAVNWRNKGATCTAASAAGFYFRQ